MYCFHGTNSICYTVERSLSKNERSLLGSTFLDHLSSKNLEVSGLSVKLSWMILYHFSTSWIDAYTKQQKPLSSERSSCPVNSAVVHSFNTRLKQFVLFGKQWKKSLSKNDGFLSSSTVLEHLSSKSRSRGFRSFSEAVFNWFYNISAQVELMRTQNNKNRLS